MQPVIAQVFTIPLSLKFIDGQPAFFNKKGYTTHILTADGNEIATFFDENIAIHHIIPFKRKTKSFFSHLYCGFLLYQYFKKHNTFIVHANTPVASLVGILGALTARTPIRIYEVHGLPLETASFWKKPIFWFVEKLICTCSTKIIAVSQSLKEEMIRRKIAPIQKIKVAHYGSCNGVDCIEKFNPDKVLTTDLTKLRIQHNLSETQKVVGFVGRITKEKGIVELYQAWQQVKKSQENTVLLIVGGQDERSPLSADWLDKISADVSIRYVGYVEEVVNYYALMNFLVLPSHREGFGNVVLEAAAMKIPSIVTNTTGLQDAVVEHITGLFCEKYSVDDLALKMTFYLNNEKIRNKHGEAAYERASKQFIPQDIWEAKWKIYSS